MKYIKEFLEFNDFEEDWEEFSDEDNFLKLIDNNELCFKIPRNKWKEIAAILDENGYRWENGLNLYDFKPININYKDYYYVIVKKNNSCTYYKTTKESEMKFKIIEL